MSAVDHNSSSVPRKAQRLFIHIYCPKELNGLIDFNSNTISDSWSPGGGHESAYPQFQWIFPYGGKFPPYTILFPHIKKCIENNFTGVLSKYDYSSLVKTLRPIAVCCSNKTESSHF